MIGIIIAIVVVVLIVLWVVSVYNSLIRKKNKCEEAFSTMDVYLKQRFDLIPNLVSTVKGYAKHESETLEKVIAARSTGSASVSQRIEEENQLTQALSRFVALAEQYPDLKANQNFLELQRQLQSVEKDILNSRKYYNGSVREFNDAIMVVPNNIIAGIGGFTKLPLYEVTDAKERENVKVEF